MDIMECKSAFARHLVSRMLEKAILKKTGMNVAVGINTLKIEHDDVDSNQALLSLNVVIATSSKDLKNFVNELLA